MNRCMKNSNLLKVFIAVIFVFAMIVSMAPSVSMAQEVQKEGTQQFETSGYIKVAYEVKDTGKQIVAPTGNTGIKAGHEGSGSGNSGLFNNVRTGDDFNIMWIAAFAISSAFLAMALMREEGRKKMRDDEAHRSSWFIIMVLSIAFFLLVSCIPVESDAATVEHSGTSGTVKWELDISGFDTAQVTNMENMFEGSNNLQSINLGSFFLLKIRQHYQPQLEMVIRENGQMER